LLLGSCAQLIGLSDYDTGQANDEGGGGEADTGGTSGSDQGGSGGMAAKPGIGGEDDGGQGGSIGGRPPVRGGAGGDGGVGGEPDGGEAGKGGTGATGGTAGGGGGASGAGGAGNAGSGNAGTGGSGGSPVCTEITITDYVPRCDTATRCSLVDQLVTPTLATFSFDVDPELGMNFQDTFRIEFWDSGTSGSYDGRLLGSFPLGQGGDDANYAFCSRCLLLHMDEESSREKMLFQTEGTITLEVGSDQMNGFPIWTFTDVTLREVTLDTDQISTVVPGGDCVHITTHTFTREAPTNWACDIVYYTDADCDCGCGQFDPTCTSTSDTVCEYCWCNGVGTCTPNEVVASSNWLCN
jgi:hypothetical protein